MASLELSNISKSFDDVPALVDASMSVREGTVHALLGENGAGKTTLMRIAFGMVEPDAGRILVDGVQQRYESPADAIAAGIGMIHQHFALVQAMSAAENIALGGSALYDRRSAIAEVERLSAETGLHVDPAARIGDLGIGGQQRVEILKALSRNARILVLDEPTAVLAPTEARSLLDWIRNFASGRRAAVLITHKVREALRVADDITVLRRGRSVLARPNTATTETDLAQAMVDQTPVTRPRYTLSKERTTVASLENVSVTTGERNMLSSTTLVVRAHEIVGVAGVEGSGYRELLRVIAGRMEPSRGRRMVPDTIGFIPEDRHREALAMDMTASENIAMRGLGSRRGVIDWTSVRALTESLASSFDVRGPVRTAPVRMLSGGNQQKLILARELGDNPQLVVAENPTRGLDFLATAAVHDRLLAARARGAGVVVYSTDLEELMAIADRLVVTHAGTPIEVPVNMEAVTRALVGLSA